MQKASSFKSSDSDENLISDKLLGPKGFSETGKMMSYGSNFGKDKPNFYDSDYINQE